jgi:HlyD family secretion protein
MSTRTRWVLSAVTVVVLAAAVLFVASRNGAGVAVDTDTPARRATFRSTVTASGEIVATRYADIGSSVMGKIVSLPVREGDRVRAGQVLARIDAVQAQSDVTGASAQVNALEAEARAAAERVKTASADLAGAEAREREATLQATRIAELLKQGIVAKADYDNALATADAATAAVASARATVDLARQSEAAAARRVTQAKAQQTRAQDILTKTSVVSPIDGIVSRLQVREGEMVVIGIQNQPGTTLMTVSDLSQIDAEVKAAEADVLRLAVGQSATVTLEAIPGRQFQGTVVEIGASALPVTGTAASAREFKVVVRLDKPDPGLRPGLTCDAEVVTSEKSNVLTVPLQSVVLRPVADGGSRAGVFVVRDGRAVFTPVTSGVIGGLDIEISGITENDAIVVGPYQVLRDLVDGATVAVTPKKS